MPLELSFAAGDYDRIAPVRTGEVNLDGIELEIADEKPPGLFRHVIERAAYDVVEMSFASYLVWADSGDLPYVGLPIFPSRSFRHSSIYVNPDSGIDEPTDLEGRSIGIFAEYQTTAGVVARGALQHQYDVSLEEITWYTAREERLPLTLPEHIDKQVVDPDEDLEKLAIDGVLDGLITPLIPAALGGGVDRLFPDYKRQEVEYYRETGNFPIMHLVLLRRDRYEAHPWIVDELYRALTEAKARALRRLYTAAALPVSLPWLVDHVEETRRLLGADFWPYGFESNRRAIELGIDYAFEQGLTRERLQPEALFVDELQDTDDRE